MGICLLFSILWKPGIQKFLHHIHSSPGYTAAMEGQPTMIPIGDPCSFWIGSQQGPDYLNLLLFDAPSL